MAHRQKAILAAALLLGALIVLLAGVRASRGPTELAELADDEPGTEALAQIYGGASDTGALGSGDPEPAPAEVDASSIRGRVVLPNGEPAIGARITATTPLGEPVMDELVDEGGAFALEGLNEGLYVLEATHGGFGPAIAVGVPTGGAPVRLVLQSGRALEGLVLSRGQPVPYAVVHVGGPGLFPQRRAIADSRGRFEVAGLRAGRYEIAVTAPGVGSGFGGTVSVDETTEGATIRVDLPVYPAATTLLSVLDRRTDEPIPFGVVTISEGPMHVLALHALLEAGEANIDFLPRGDYYIRIRAPGYLPLQRRIYVTDAGEGIEVRLSQGGTVSGTVRDEAGNGVEGAQLSAVVETEDGARWEMQRALFDDFHRLVRPDGTPFWLPSVLYQSGEDGAYALTGLPEGSVRIVARKAGYAPAVSPALETALDEFYQGNDLVLTRERRLRGRVEDEGGGPVEGALVTVRTPSMPSWAGGDVAETGRDGVFELDGLGASGVLRVEHPDFAPLERTLEIPAEGLDDLILTLSGEVLPSLRGRVFTSRGAPALGATVWLMSGASMLPACRATVSADAWFRATHCTAQPDRILINAEGHAPLVAELGGDGEPRDWELPLGGELALVSQRTAVYVEVEPLFALPQAIWPRPRLTLERWSRHVEAHVAPGRYQVVCKAEGFDDGLIEVDVAAGRRVEAPCPALQRMVEFEVVVVDGQGAPVEGALVFIDGLDPPLRAFTNGQGRVSATARPNRWLVAEAMHEDWGRGVAPLQSPDNEPSEPVRVRLNTSIAGEDPGGFVEQLGEWGIGAELDGRSVVVETVAPGTPAAGMGLQRYDRLLWARELSAFRFSVGLRRDGELFTYELVREPSPD